MSRRKLISIAQALMFATIGAGVQLVTELGLVGPLFGLSQASAVTLAAVGAIAAGLFGLAMGYKQIYSLEPRAIWAFVIDVSWSAINTITGLVWMIWCAAKGTYQEPNAATQKRGIIVFRGPALPGADATTIGTVIGGRWLLHEAVHVQQARIFGPFYWPTYLISYGANLLIRLITLRFGDVHWESYGRVVMEDWAYRSAPHDHAHATDLKPTLRWLSLALLNAVAVAVLLGPVPVIGTLVAVAGLAIVPWWAGLFALIGYAVIRNVFPKSRSIPQTPVR